MTLDEGFAVLLNLLLVAALVEVVFGNGGTESEEDDDAYRGRNIAAGLDRFEGPAAAWQTLRLSVLIDPRSIVTSVEIGREERMRESIQAEQFLAESSALSSAHVQIPLFDSG